MMWPREAHPAQPNPRYGERQERERGEKRRCTKGKKEKEIMHPPPAPTSRVPVLEVLIPGLGELDDLRAGGGGGCPGQAPSIRAGGPAPVAARP